MPIRHTNRVISYPPKAGGAPRRQVKLLLQSTLRCGKEFKTQNSVTHALEMSTRIANFAPGIARKPLSGF
ncbi:MAG: hypothetical protein A2289_16805 [Deltaproteobacteria bacterium RIFOXYA12_FULL_58_15]|nr:MAG: hypothetical protein A2289_16805 [Deltaproteobacteria bacterium RIFOXYA12_FULL_58_15]OGR08711.1 MAG: hypothetical protein A2341_00750 [Deltaproteobacteria bacterium RIFOXYB12_FULL_58_9]